MGLIHWMVRSLGFNETVFGSQSDKIRVWFDVSVGRIMVEAGAGTQTFRCLQAEGIIEVEPIQASGFALN